MAKCLDKCIFNLPSNSNAVFEFEAICCPKINCRRHLNCFWDKVFSFLLAVVFECQAHTKKKDDRLIRILYERMQGPNNRINLASEKGLCVRISKLFICCVSCVCVCAFDCVSPFCNNVLAGLQMAKRYFMLNDSCARPGSQKVV